jgi:hypothetical protein
VPYGLNLTIHLAMSGTIGRIESPSHPISIAFNGGHATVTLSQREAALDRDFVLAFDAAALHTPQAWLEREDDGRQAVAIACTPNLPDTAGAAELVFLVDRSGSMQGTSIEEVRNALQLCLRSMVAGCHFNIIGFGSTTDALFRQSREYNDASLRDATAHVAALEANLGGTEILPALQLALDQPRHTSLARQVIVLTDGQVSNTDAVLALAKKHAAHARIFTFGIGAGASHHLVRGLARAAGGTAEFVYPGERVEPKVVRHFARLLSPALTNVRVDWGGLEVIQAPSMVPPVFAGGRLLLYGFLRSELRGGTATTVRLLADAPAGPVVFDVPVDPGRVEPGTTVATLGARARIRELEESPEWTTTRASRQQERKAAGVAREIIELSIRYGLMSRETSYVAIERRDTPLTGEVQLRRVPVALTTGWGGIERGVGRAQVRASRVETSGDWFFAGAMLGSGEPGRSRVFGRVPMGGAPDAERSSASWIPRAVPEYRSKSSISRLDAIYALITLQRADGSWKLTRDFATVIGYDMRELKSALRGSDAEDNAVTTAWATALALAWLETHASDLTDQWRLVAEKARKWVSRVFASAPDGATWLDAAEKFIRTAQVVNLNSRSDGPVSN